MIKPKRITHVTECTIGQLYLLIHKYGSVKCRPVKCTGLFDSNRMEIDKDGYKSTIDLDNKYSSEYIYEYNSLLKLKYNRLLEQHKQELDDLLCGKDVIVYNLSELEKKDKWYKKLCKNLWKNSTKR